VTTARMKGWKTRSYEERVFNHHRKMGTAGTTELGARFRYGKKDYLLGGHPLWQIFRATFQMTKPPYVLGGLALMLGYLSCWLSGERRPVSEELMRFHRAEQMARLKRFLGGQAAVRRSARP